MKYVSTTAQQAGVDFDHLAAYITVISNTTRMSSETIGQSLRTMFSRMTDVSSGKAIDEAGEPINRVEASLARVNISLRDVNGNFRDMQDVLAEVGRRWDTFGDEDQKFIARNIAGIKQREQFLVLMAHQEEIQKAINIETMSAGLAAERYAFYLESVEAKANKAQAALEGVWQKTLDSKTVGQFYDGIAAILELIDTMGGFTSVLIVAAGAVALLNSELIANKILLGIASLQQFIGAIITATSVTEGFGAALTALSATNAIVLAITAVTLAVFEFNEQIVKTNQAGTSENLSHWIQLLSQVKKGSSDATVAVKNFKDEIIRVNKAVEDAGPILGLFVDKNGVVKNGLTTVSERLRTSAKDYKEYASSLKDALEFAGYKIDDLGNAYKEGLRGEHLYIDGLHVLSQAEYDASLATDKLNQEAKKQKDAADEAAKSVQMWVEDTQMLANTMKDLSDGVSLTSDMIKKSLSGKLEFGDIQKLVDANADYLDYITFEDGQIKINTEGLKAYDLAKADDAIATAKLAFGTGEWTEAQKKQIQILQQYRDAIFNGTVYEQAYADAAKEAQKAAEEADKARLKAMEDQAAAAKKLLDMIVKMIEEQKKAEKQHLQDQLANYKSLIEASKAALDAKKAESDYQKNLKKDEKVAGDLESQIAILSLDNSAEAKAKKLELEKQLADQKDKIDSEQSDHSVKTQKDALDKEEKAYEKYINKKIKKIDDYLAKTGQIVQDAINMIQTQGQGLYDQLMQWNMTYGTGIAEDVTSAWAAGYDALLNYQQLLDQIANFKATINTTITTTTTNAPPSTDTQTDSTGSGGGSTSPGAPGGGRNNGGSNQNPYHSGLDRGPIGSDGSNSIGEVFIKAMKGEVVINQPQMASFLSKTLPSIAQTTSNMNSGGGLTIGTLLNVQGSLDKTTLPDVERMMNKTVEKINNIMLKRGYLRPTNLSSI